MYKAGKVCREKEEAGWNDDVRGLNVAFIASYTASMLLLEVRIYKWWHLTPPPFKKAYILWEK